MDLQHIFDAITPDNIKDIPLLKFAMEVFIEELHKNSSISSQIMETYNTSYDRDDTQILQDAKDKRRTGLIKVYLSALYNVITKAQTDKVIQAKLEATGLTDIHIANDAIRILNDEHFLTNKEFKEKVGTSLGVEYAYNLTRYLQSVEEGSDLTLTEVKPFHFTTEGAVLKELYENIVKPLSHPLGFTYSYNQLIEESFQDLFGITVTYDVRSVEIRGLNGDFDVFTPDADDTNVKADFLSRVNPLTQENFTEAEYDAQVVVWTNKVVQEFKDTVEGSRNLRFIRFTDDTIIERYTNPIEILYTTYSSWLDGSRIPLKVFDGHYSVYADYDSDFVIDYTDEVLFTEEKALSDVFSVTDTNFVIEEFVAYGFSATGHYLHTEETLTAIVQSISGDGATVTVSTTTPHGLTTGDLVDIVLGDGANPHNGTWTVAGVTNTHTFTYTDTETTGYSGPGNIYPGDKYLYTSDGIVTEDRFYLTTLPNH